MVQSSKVEYCEYRGPAVYSRNWPDDQTWFRLWNMVVYGDKRLPSYSEWIVPGTIDVEIV